MWTTTALENWYFFFFFFAGRRCPAAAAAAVARDKKPFRFRRIPAPASPHSHTHAHARTHTHAFARAHARTFFFLIVYASFCCPASRVSVVFSSSSFTRFIVDFRRRVRRFHSAAPRAQQVAVSESLPVADRSRSLHEKKKKRNNGVRCSRGRLQPKPPWCAAHHTNTEGQSATTFLRFVTPGAVCTP